MPVTFLISALPAVCLAMMALNANPKQNEVAINKMVSIVLFMLACLCVYVLLVAGEININSDGVIGLTA